MKVSSYKILGMSFVLFIILSYANSYYQYEIFDDSIWYHLPTAFFLMMALGISLFSMIFAGEISEAINND